MVFPCSLEEGQGQEGKSQEEEGIPLVEGILLEEGSLLSVAPLDEDQDHLGPWIEHDHVTPFLVKGGESGGPSCCCVPGTAVSWFLALFRYTSRKIS